jgi:acetyltransferase-like isoleucine patch superfamily enzyme
MSLVDFAFRLYAKRKMDRLRKQGLQIGEGSRLMSPGLVDTEPYLVSIGKHVSVAGGVRFMTHDGATWVFRTQEKYKDVVKYGRITIHDNCLIGFNCILCPGVTIGPNAVVAAGSVVTQDVPAGTMVRGNPAKVVARIEDYADYCLKTRIDINPEAYARDKRTELLRFYPYPW